MFDPLRRCLVLAALCIVAPLSAQRTLVVAPGQYRSIQDAVGAANIGDIVVVRPGTWSTFTVSKGISILGDPGAVVTRHTQIGHSSITGVPVGQTLVVRGLEFRDGFGQLLRVEGCDGHVHLQDLRGTLAVTDSRQVSLQRIVAWGLPAVQVRGSNVVLVECDLRGEDGILVKAGSPGLTCEASTLVFAEGRCQGGSIGYGTAAPGPAIRSLSGSVTVVGGIDTVLKAGTSAQTPPQPTAAIEALAGRLVIAPGVSLVPTHGGAPIAGSATVVVRAMASLRAGVTARQLDVLTRAPGATAVAVLASPPLQPPHSLPFVDLWISPSTLLLDLGAPSMQGTRSTTLALPSVTPGVIVALQAVVLEAGGGFSLSTPAVTTLDG